MVTGGCLCGAVRYETDGDPFGRGFCGACGSQLLFDDSRYPDEIDIAVSTLDDPAAVPPLFNIWTRSRIPWLKLDESLPSFPERSGQ